MSESLTQAESIPPLSLAPTLPQRLLTFHLTGMQSSTQKNQNKKKKKAVNSSHVAFGDKFERKGVFTTTTASSSGIESTAQDVDLGYDQPRKKLKLTQPTPAEPDFIAKPEADKSQNRERSQASSSYQTM